jgi:L-lactate permease
MRRRLEGAVLILIVLAMAEVFHAGGLAVTILLSVATVGAAAMFVGLGWCWGRDDRIRAGKAAR